MAGPLSFKNDQKQQSSAFQDQTGASWGFDSSGWVVNVPVSSGSGLTLQGGASSGVSKWLLIGAAVVGTVLLMRGKR